MGGHKKSALINTLLIVVCVWTWVLSFTVPWAYSHVYCEDWEYDNQKYWHLANYKEALDAAGSVMLTQVFFVSVVVLPCLILLTTILLWFVPMGPHTHSKLRLAFSW